MVITYPYADHLTVEEVDYELSLRKQDDKKMDLSAKLRLLRRLFKEDQQERNRYRPLCQFEKEANPIKHQVEILLKGLQEKPDVKLVSRLRHYYHRVFRAEAATEEGIALRQDLLERILDAIEKAPKNIQILDDIGSGTDKQDEAVGGSDSNSKKANKNSLENTELVKPIGSGAVPKDPKKNTAGQPSYEDLLERIKQLEARLEQSVRKNDRQNQVDPLGFRGRFSQGIRQEITKNDRIRHSSGNWFARHQREMNDSSDSDQYDWNGGSSQQIRNQQRGASRNVSQVNEGNSGSSDWYGSQGNRGPRHFRRIEHWKLSFSGDSKSVSVENFLYKLKKIATREGVSDADLLRDIHLILEGQASDWFFTYVDEFVDWKDFDDKIRYRFGNPNQDQGIRLKIQERKQQRGESFSAFVSEIERLNKMLSKPLSNRRKFEVVWDNMRHHYRSKIATIDVRDLDHLIKLNHGIDAVDPGFQYSSEMRNQRNVHHVDCNLSDEVSDEPEEIDVIRTMDVRNQRNQTNRNTTSETPQKAAQNICWNCRKLGHNWRDCKEAKAIFCFGCGNLGRTIRSCPKCSGSRYQRIDGNQGNL